MSDTPRTDDAVLTEPTPPESAMMYWHERAFAAEAELAAAKAELASYKSLTLTLAKAEENACIEAYHADEDRKKAEAERDALMEQMKFPPPKGTVYGDPETIKVLLEDAEAAFRLSKECRSRAVRAEALLNCRAGKLLLKGKAFIVVAHDEPYYLDVYGTIRSHEINKGRWNDEDELHYQSAIDAERAKG